MITHERKQALIGFAIKGANLLDIKGPACWADLVDLSKLNMNSMTHCVAAQAAGEGSYRTAMNTLELDWTTACDYGFDTMAASSQATQEFTILHNAWVGLVAVRQVNNGDMRDYTQYMKPEGESVPATEHVAG